MLSCCIVHRCVKSCEYHLDAYEFSCQVLVYNHIRCLVFAINQAPRLSPNDYVIKDREGVCGRCRILGTYVFSQGVLRAGD